MFVLIASARIRFSAHSERFEKFERHLKSGVALLSLMGKNFLLTRPISYFVPAIMS